MYTAETPFIMFARSQRHSCTVVLVVRLFYSTQVMRKQSSKTKGNQYKCIVRGVVVAVLLLVVLLVGVVTLYKLCYSSCNVNFSIISSSVGSSNILMLVSCTFAPGSIPK